MQITEVIIQDIFLNRERNTTSRQSEIQLRSKYKMAIYVQITEVIIQDIFLNRERNTTSRQLEIQLRSKYKKAI
ncbi:hypothetical protein [Chitinophaga sp.]|uniref:hypothetical protein n=1 Tax=Chitinophaga sp. TaxID=1869181 RepID=UPI0031E17FDE